MALTVLVLSAGCREAEIQWHRSVPVTRDIGRDDGGEEARYRMITAITERPDATWFFKAAGPLALGMAERLIDAGASLPLGEALQLELRHLREIFATADALAGLESVLNKTKAKFQGR